MIQRRRALVPAGTIASNVLRRLAAGLVPAAALLVAFAAPASSASSLFAGRNLNSRLPRWFSRSSIGSDDGGGNSSPAAAAAAAALLFDVRGGAAPGEKESKEAKSSEEGQQPPQETVDAADLYLPGLLDASIHRSKDVRYPVAGKRRVRKPPIRYCCHDVSVHRKSILYSIPTHLFLFYLYNRSLRLPGRTRR